MKRARAWLLGLLGLLGLAVALGTGLAVLYWCQLATPRQVEATLDALKAYFVVWRVLVFGGLILLWDRCVLWLAGWRDWRDDHTNRLLKARWQVALWLVALELALGQNVVGQFIKTLGQGQ